MAVVILINKTVGDDEVHQYGGVECDAEGCTVIVKVTENGPSLFDQGWFIEPGKHRCPEHFHVETPRREPQRRFVDKAGKRI